MTLQKIVTFIIHEESDDVQALTREEFTTNTDFDEWVWHLAPSKEAAIEAHYKAFDLWVLLDFEFYDHSNPQRVQWNHAFDLNFDVTTDREDGEDITADQVRALLTEALTKSDQELLGAINIFDSIKVVTRVS